MTAERPARTVRRTTGHPEPGGRTRLFTGQEPEFILEASAAEGPAVKRGHRQRSLP